MDDALLSETDSDPHVSMQRSSAQASASVRDSTKNIVSTCGLIDRYHYAIDSFHYLDWDAFHPGAGARPFRGFWCSHRGKRRGQNCPCEKCSDLVVLVVLVVEFILAVQLSTGGCPSAGQWAALSLTAVVATAMILDASVVVCLNYYKLSSLRDEEDLPLIPIAAQGVTMGRLGANNMFLTFSARAEIDAESLSLRQKKAIYSRLRASTSAELTVMVHDSSWYNNNFRNPQRYVCFLFLVQGFAIYLLTGTVHHLLSSQCV